MGVLNRKKLFLLDMDGTIYLDNTLFDGTLEFLDYVKSIGGRYIFLTNNSSKGVDTYIQKLASLGIKSTADDFLTSTDATILLLKKKNYKKIYAFGTESFRRQLSDSGLAITDVLEEDIDCLCISNDQELTFKKLEDACILLGKDVDYIATNPDWVCPTWYGYVPDCGAVCQMLKHATGKEPFFVGKPRPAMAELAIEKTGYTKEETVIFGDRIYTDIACGVNAKISSVFVLSGEGVIEDIDKFNIHPEFVFNNIKEIYNYLKENAN